MNIFLCGKGTGTGTSGAATGTGTGGTETGTSGAGTVSGTSETGTCRPATVPTCNATGTGTATGTNTGTGGMGLLALVLLLLLLAGVIITGGELTKTAVEVYNSVSQNTCSLEQLPNSYSHTLCGGLLCGGGPQSSRRKRCLKFDANTYTFSLTDLNLKKWSVSSLCWPVDNEGILLLGGLHNARCRTEYVKADASDSCESFHLRNPVV